MVEGHSSVSGFPTIYHLHNGKKVSEFKKERNLENFKHYIDTIERHYRKQTRKSAKGGSRIRRNKSVNKKRKTRRHKKRNKTHKRKTKHNRRRK